MGAGRLLVCTVLLSVYWQITAFEIGFRCGVPARSANKVIGGKNTEPSEYTWQAFLRVWIKGKSYMCGGSLVDENTILSAAHCFQKQGVMTSSVDIVLSEHDRDTVGDKELFLAVPGSSITVHPQYDEETHEHDMATIRLNSPIDWAVHPHIRPICLPSPSKTMDNYSNRLGLKKVVFIISYFSKCFFLFFQTLFLFFVYHISHNTFLTFFFTDSYVKCNIIFPSYLLHVYPCFS